jgi:hypothetical protein
VTRKKYKTKFIEEKKQIELISLATRNRVNKILEWFTKKVFSLFDRVGQSDDFIQK